MVCLLTDLSDGKKGIIKEIRAGKAATQRLTDMGLTVGTTFTIKRIAPFEGPVCVVMRDSSLAIGRGIASKIVVEEIE